MCVCFFLNELLLKEYLKMQGAENSKVEKGFVKFVDLFKLADLERALLPHKGTEQYDAVIRYYFACIGLLDSPRLLQPLTLFKQALGELGNHRVRREAENAPAPSPDSEAALSLAQVSDRVEGFEARLRYGVELMKTPATQVPKILHFVWLGGGLGDIQRDYINVWKKVLAGQGYKINVWYDNDALLAYRTNQLVVEAAKADAMQHGGVDSATERELGELYVARVIALKQQMYQYINDAVAKGESADAARMQLLVRGYGQDAQELRRLKTTNRDSIQALVDGDVQVRDLAGAEKPLQLQALYQREMRLRGNFAAASDVVRAEVLHLEGGSYTDVDNLPPLLKSVGGVDISGFSDDARLGLLQLLLNENPEWMPGRQALKSRYVDRTDEIPEAHRQALQAFAKGKPLLAQVFQPPQDLLVRPYALRAVAVRSTISNGYMMAHPGSAVLESVLKRLEFNLGLVDATARLAVQRGVKPEDSEAMQSLALEELERTYGSINDLPDMESVFATYLADAAASYYNDGIRPQSEGTIYLTGPVGIKDGTSDFEKARLTPRGAQVSREEMAIEPLLVVNRATEEELDHSWKDNETDFDKWVESEKQRWRDGQFKTRYAGNIDELLKHSTVEFELGWPLIEGRHVINTELLQRMADHLGEPFTRAMMSGHDGPVTFADRIPLDFNDRQLIRNQDTRRRPPASRSHEVTRSLALDEILTGLGTGAWQLAHLSPLQRLTLGALLGAESLDEQSFAALGGALDNLINSLSERGTSGRYAAIEQHLYQRRPAEFVAGLKSVADVLPTSSSNALSLKKTALSTAVTLHDWGRQVALIQYVATQEHRQQVQERVEQVLNQFEAGTVKMVPQDLLLHGAGDTVAGRCFPLVLAMSAALTQGEAASRRLRERFFLAVLEPDQADSQAFLQAVEEMHGVKAGDVGTVLGRLDLETVAATLEASVGTRTLMLNSDNHSMLVARTESGTNVTYHFYDPNFGVFEFDSSVSFKVALGKFFRLGMARHYAAYGEADHPRFDLIDIKGQQVSEQMLSTGVKVAHLFTEDTLPNVPLRKVRQRLNSAHGRALMENPRLGRALFDADHHWWAEQIASATSRLQEGHDSVSPLVPLFSSLEFTHEGPYRLGMLDPNTGELVATVTSIDGRLLRIRNYLSELFSTLGRKPVKAGATQQATEAAAVHTLNAGFAVQALMNALRGREGDDRTMTTAVRWHAYVNYAQLAHGTLFDAAGLIALVKEALRDEKIIARTSARVVGEALAPLTGKTIGAVAGHVANEGVGAVLGLANVGFDIYQLATAQNDLETVTYATQLTFDATSLALTGAGMGAGLAGAGTAAAVLGGAGVIIGGLAVGVTALAQAYAIIAEEAKAVGLFFNELEQAHRGQAYHYKPTQDVWLPRASLIVTDIDMDTGEVSLESTKLYPLRDHFGVPEFEADYARAINLSKELGYPDRMRFVPPADQAIVLPCTPQACYRYEYQTLPFSSHRHDTGFDIARRLEKRKPDGKWLFLHSFYSFPSHYIVNRLWPDYRATQISVKLDARERKLVVPNIPPAWQDKLSYRLQGGASLCTLVLSPGANVELVSAGTQNNRWILVAPWASESDIQFGKTGAFSVKDCQFKMSGTGPSEVFLVIDGGRLLKVEGSQQRRLVVVQEQAPKGIDGQVLQDHLLALARDHRLALPYTRINNYPIPFEKAEAPRYTTGWYDAAEDRVLHIRNDYDLSEEDLMLSAVAGEFAYFHEKDGFDILQVDASTGLLSHRYRLLVRKQGTGTIRSVEADGHGVLHVVQEYVQPDATVERFNYLIHDGQMWLSSVNRGLELQFEALLDDRHALTDWVPVLGDRFLFPPVLGEREYTTVDWQFAPYVSICWKMDETLRDMAWIRSRDNLIIRPVPRRHHLRGWRDSVQNLNDLMLLTVAGDNDVFVIYDRLFQKLCRVERTVVQGENRWSHRWVQPDRLKEVIAEQNSYLAKTEDGLVFEMGADGNAQFAGVGERWLKGRAQWWLALESLALQHEAEQFSIVGIANVAADAGVHGWFVGNRLLLSEVGSADVRLLGLTPDNQSAWLFDPAAGAVWRQAFVDPQRLGPAFGSGSQLRQADAVPKPEREWERQSFTDVWIEGAGLMGTTRDGVVFELHYQEQPMIVAVAPDWVAAQGESVTESLHALLATEAHRPFISVASRDPIEQWYIVDSGRLVRVAAADLPKDFQLLGTRRYADVLLHEPEARLVQGFPSKHRIGPLDYVRRVGEVLVIQGRMDANDLMPLIPDDVLMLVVRMGRGSMKCHLTPALARKLDSLVVDCRFPLGGTPLVPGRLIWSPDSPQKLEASLVGDHLIVVDPDSEHNLIWRNACASDTSLRGDAMLEVQGLRRCKVSSLVRWLMERRGGSNSVKLKELLDEAKGKVTADSTL